MFFGTGKLEDDPTAPYLKYIGCKVGTCDDTSVTSCENKKFCFFQNNQYCVPEDEDSVSCITSDEIPDNIVETAYGFGYHTSECVGGTVRPISDSGDQGFNSVSGVVLFEEGGVIQTITQLFVDKPPVVRADIFPFTENDLRGMKQNVEQVKLMQEELTEIKGELSEEDFQNINNANTNKNKDFYCNLVAFPDGSMIKEISLTSAEKNQFVAENLKWNDFTKLGSAFGIYGADIIRHKKTNMKARCDVRFEYEFGSPFTRDHGSISCDGPYN